MFFVLVFILKYKFINFKQKYLCVAMFYAFL